MSPKAYSLEKALLEAGIRKAWQEQPRDDIGRWSDTGSDSNAKGGAEGVPDAAAKAPPTESKQYRSISDPALNEFAAKETQATENQWKSLSEAEKNAVMDYTGETYADINEALGEHSGDVSKMSGKDKSGITENTTLYRAMDVSKLGDFNVGQFDKIENIKKEMMGKVLQDHAFGSTTASMKVAGEFSGARSNRIVMEIQAPKGSKGLWLGDKTRSKSPGEAEFLLQRGSRYIVTGVVKKRVNDRDVSVLQVSLLPHDGKKKK